MVTLFKLNQEYAREKEIHSILGGNTTHGSIQKSSKNKIVMLFSGEYGAQDWYRDDWVEGDGYYKFCGSGDPGAMTLARHNSIIINHIKEDARLLLFRSNGKGQKYKYLGEFYYWKHEIEPSNVDSIRWGDILVFHLLPYSQNSFTANIDELLSRTEALRGKKWDAPPLGQPTPQKSQGSNTSNFKRDPETRAFVLDRAKGICELCASKAPFSDSRGLPFLEAHHVTPLSQGGADTWYNLSAVCPNCHRELHHGTERDAKTESLLKKLLDLRRQL